MKFNKQNLYITFSSILLVWITVFVFGFFVDPEYKYVFISTNILCFIAFLSAFYSWFKFQSSFLKRNSHLEGVVVDLLVNSSIPMVITNEHFEIIDYNSGFKYFFGLPDIELQSEKMLFQAIDLIPETNKDFSFTINKDGNTWTDVGKAKLSGGSRIDLEIETTFSPDSKSYILFLRNTTEFKAVEYQLNDQIYTDHLTKIPNRKAFLRDFKEFQNEYKKLENPAFSAHLAAINLDKFSSVNSSEGLESGNLVLVDFSVLLKSQIKDIDVKLYHFGGDEFFLLFRNWMHTDVESFIKTLINTFQHNQQLNDTGYNLSSSFGVVKYPDNGKGVDTLFKHIDVSMGYAKKILGNSFVFFNQTMADLIANRNQMLMEMKRSLESQNGFHLVYQPKINIHDGSFAGVEVLLRWKYNNHPMSPTKFIPIAEESGLAAPLFQFVFETALTELKYLIGDKIPSFSVNVSAKQLASPAEIKTFISILEKHQTYSKHVILEITETCIMENVDIAIDCLNIVKKMGYRVSIDDFGTGYSSLSTMKVLPIEELKIDRSFIKNIPNEKDQVIVNAIIQMAKSFDFKVVAEGIEEKEQLDFLETTDCDIIQGFFFSKPLDIERLKIFSVDTF